MRDWWILWSAWVILPLLLWWLVPKRKWRDACLIFMFQQFFTWGAGLFPVEMRWIEYPVRLFADANRTSFTFEYFSYPAISVLFVLRFPEDSTRFRAFLQYLWLTAVLTLAEVLLERYTKLVHYSGWNWYWSALTIWTTLYLVRRYYLWYRKGLHPVGAGERDVA